MFENGNVHHLQENLTRIQKWIYKDDVLRFSGSDWKYIAEKFVKKSCWRGIKKPKKNLCCAELKQLALEEEICSSFKRADANQSNHKSNETTHQQDGEMLESEKQFRRQNVFMSTRFTRSNSDFLILLRSFQEASCRCQTKKKCTLANEIPCIASWLVVLVCEILNTMKHEEMSIKGLEGVPGTHENGEYKMQSELESGYTYLSRKRLQVTIVTGVRLFEHSM